MPDPLLRSLADAARAVTAAETDQDVLNIVDGREELADEMAQAPPELRDAVGAAFARLLANRDFSNVLPGLLAEPERAALVRGRLGNMAR